MMPPTIDALPEKCLIAVLRSLPLKEVLQVASVCRLWNEAVKKVCHERVSLNIRGRSILNVDSKESARHHLILSDFLAFFGVDHYDLFEPYLLSSLFGVNEDRIKTSSFLVRKFPNIRRFSYYGGGIVFKDLMNLLTHWKHLSHLTLIIPTAFNWPLAWKYINTLRSLTHLSLIADGFVFLPRVMPRLVQFNYATVDGVSKAWLIGSLNPQQIQQIGIGCFEQQTFDLNRNQRVIRRLILANMWLSKCVTRFSNHLSSVNMSFLNFICNHFTSLQFLNISFSDSVTFNELFEKLCKLTELQHLRIGSLRQNARVEEMRLVENDPFRLITKENVQSILKLTSVRVLHIYDFEIDNAKLSLLECMFPAVESILIQDQANFCSHQHPYRRMVCEICPKEVFKTLSQIKSVRTVRVVSNGQIIFEK